MMNKDAGNVLTFSELADQALEGKRDIADRTKPTGCLHFSPILSHLIPSISLLNGKERCSERLGNLPMATQRGSGRARTGAQNRDSTSAPLYSELGRL